MISRLICYAIWHGSGEQGWHSTRLPAMWFDSSPMSYVGYFVVGFRFTVRVFLQVLGFSYLSKD